MVCFHKEQPQTRDERWWHT